MLRARERYKATQFADWAAQGAPLTTSESWATVASGLGKVVGGRCDCLQVLGVDAAQLHAATVRQLEGCEMAPHSHRALPEELKR
jgi:hypothetical protein